MYYIRWASQPRFDQLYVLALMSRLKKGRNRSGGTKYAGISTLSRSKFRAAAHRSAQLFEATLDWLDRTGIEAAAYSSLIHTLPLSIRVQ